jgi:flagellar motility protein MotE (MotC chaperone)
MSQVSKPIQSTDVDNLKQRLAELEALVRAQQETLAAHERKIAALIEHVEEVEDNLEIHLGDEEMAQAGEEPIPLEQIEKEMGL